ncbi:hypothetical protein [Thalassospira profundimaris]|nr:hypothetical protein [Thalassospira profundimaris]
MAKDSRATTLPVLSPDLGERIRHVVDMFDRKKDAAAVAGVIPEQLNRWCQAKSEPRFVGIARLARAKSVRLEWIVTGEGPVHHHAEAYPGPASEMPHSKTENILQALHPDADDAPDSLFQPPQNLEKDGDGIRQMISGDGSGPASESAQKKSAHQTQKTHNSRVSTRTGDNTIQFSNDSLLSAIITGFLTTEGIDNAPIITRNILATYREIIHLLGNEPDQAETGTLIAQIVSAIIRHHTVMPHRETTETK